MLGRSHFSATEIANTNENRNGMPMDIKETALSTTQMGTFYPLLYVQGFGNYILTVNVREKDCTSYQQTCTICSIG